MSTAQYAFSDRAQEQRRLATQAELLDPLTERVFREAGLGTGMRVLDLGSGAGDVAILAARLVLMSFHRLVSPLQTAGLQPDLRFTSF